MHPRSGPALGRNPTLIAVWVRYPRASIKPLWGEVIAMDRFERRGRDKIFDNIYRAVLLCKLAGLSFAETKNILREVFKNPPLLTVKDWYYGRRKHRLSKLNTLDKALWYHTAYEVVIKLKTKHLQWSYKKISSELKKYLPIKIPLTTIYYWLSERSKPNVTNVKVCPALGYLVGVLVGDYKRKRNERRARNKNLHFIKYYVQMYEKVTSIKLKIFRDKYGRYYTSERGTFLKILWRTGLWKIIAHIYPREFLQGLFDSEGSITHTMYKGILKGYTLNVTIGSHEVLETCIAILNNLNFKFRIDFTPPSIKKVRRKYYKFGGYYRVYILGGKQTLYRFEAEIGFRESNRRIKLLALLEAFKHPPKDRHKIYYKLLNSLPLHNSKIVVGPPGLEPGTPAV
ncbi:MAG TPA: hypothetical protein ENG54_00575 [Thermofilum sp.]|nr:hypothetical protein [Thermofilum sp.]